MTALLEARGVTRRYGDGRRRVDALRRVDLAVPPGARIGIVGESGSGKSTLVRLLAALDRPTSGETLFRGRRTSGVPERGLADLRSSVQLVFQDPRSSLDPRMTVGRIVTEPLRSRRLRHRGDVPSPSADRLQEVLAGVGLAPELAHRYPHELSGGQRQRVAIARALAPDPEVLIADEPVSALDVAVRAHVLNLLADLVRARGLTLVFVSHDLAVVRLLCDTVVVMKDGVIVEQGSMEEVYDRPRDPYTAALLAAVPRLRS
ncbi:ABC transporter ATP-binding protein [Propionicicella superfundia]|uniref:ABC transporter ATP-binding protein n=1 Tax=Propionicicella superfundia TaxID=348582 RepID=UPI001FDFFB0F|nr:ABC transporter ATP-binding protein [Propionicicella superfundia]